MESSENIEPTAPTAAEAAAILGESRQAQSTIATTLTLPRGYSAITGTANAILVGGVAAGNSGLRIGSFLFPSALAVMVALQQVAMQRFRRLNGVWIGGHRGARDTWTVLAVFGAAMLAACGVAVWLTVNHRPVQAAVVALLVIPATYAADRWWMARHLRLAARRLGAGRSR